MHKRCVALLLSAMGAPLAPVSAWAQDYPSRPVRFIVGFVPGGVADLLARALGQKLTDAWGQQVIVDNRAGGGGVISMQIVAKAAPDGYTLLMGSSTQFSINPALRPNLPYHPVRDYTPVTNAAITPVILTVQAASAARSLQDLIQMAKKGEAMSYGSTGYGGAPHIAGELLKRAAGIQMTHVPFKGGGDSIIAIMGGHVQASFGAVSTAQPHVRGGRLRALGVTTLKRMSAIAEVPTFAEQGLPGFEVVQWYGVFAPAALPPPILRKANETLVRALGAPEFREQFNAQGVELMQSTPSVFAAYVVGELARWTKVLKEMGIHEAP
ncbi:MAG TPA: tripartite tricarboxylate transporter substrate binding protein [Burkholderiales bacterium]|nr:tripartite tricarboxylate transporter substrate binding protein [Burkholderiales bacterium]